MKNDFDNLTLRYLSIYNEGYSSEYGEDERDYEADRQRMIKHDEGERHYTPEQQRAVDDIMSRIKITGGSHEDSESSDYISKRYTPEWMAYHGNPSSGPRPEGPTPVEAWDLSPGGQREQAKRRKYLAMSDDEARAYLKQKRNEDNESDNGPAIKDDCEECGNGGCVGDDGYCHYCNLEDEDEDRDEDDENYRPYHT